MTDLDILRATIAKAEAAAPGHVDTLGLIPGDEMRPSGYEDTPEGARTFAWTGGDGVHFSLAGETGPVVMTVPMNWDHPNVVLGADLREFLGLGLRSGYFILEQLSYSPEEMLGALQTGIYSTQLSEDDRVALDMLREAFELREWSDIPRRFAELQQLYRPGGG